MADFSPLQKIFATQGGGGERPQAGSRFGLSWPFLGALCIVLTGAVAWAFFMGYMVGKGEHPGETLGVTAGANSTGNLEAPPVFLEASPQGEETERQAEAGSEPVKGISADGAIQPVALPKPAVRAAPKPAPKPAARAAVLQKPSSDTRYNYTFQIAAMHNASEAENLRKKIAAQKWRVSTQKSGRVYLVLVNLRGNHADVAKFQDSLKKIHAGKPLQISRKPIDTPKKPGSR